MISQARRNHLRNDEIYDCTPYLLSSSQRSNIIRHIEREVSTEEGYVNERIGCRGSL